MPTVALILPTATYRAAAFLAAAETLRADVVVASEGAQALADEMGGRFVRIDLRRPEWSADRIVELANRQPLAAVVAADDAGVEIAAAAAARLGLRHSDPAAVAATRNKAEMRRRLAAAGVPQPRFAVARPGDDPALAGDALGFPVVLKPLSLSASRGVIRADDGDEARAAAVRIRSLLRACGEDPDEPLLVEEFVGGPEFAVEAVLADGHLEVLAIFDKPEPMDGPYFEETLLVAPARVDAKLEADLVAVAAAAAAGLGLREGPAHIELRAGARGVILLEVAARSIGGLCGRALRFGLLGESLETVLLRHALGFPPSGPGALPTAIGVMMLPVPAAGRLVEIRGRERALAVPGIADLEMTIAPGGSVVPLPEGDRYLGFLFGRGASPDEVEAALRRAHALLEIVIDPRN